VDGLSIDEVRENLRWVYRQILIDDINLLHEYCARQTENEKLVRLLKLLRSIAFLPSKATLAQFLSETKTIFFQVEMGQSLD